MTILLDSDPFIENNYKFNKDNKIILCLIRIGDLGEKGERGKNGLNEKGIKGNIEKKD